MLIFCEYKWQQEIMVVCRNQTSRIGGTTAINLQQNGWKVRDEVLYRKRQGYRDGITAFFEMELLKVSFKDHYDLGYLIKIGICTDFKTIFSKVLR